MAKILTVPIDQLQFPRALQRRAQESKEAIARYADLYAEHGMDAPLPALTVFTEDPKSFGTPTQTPLLVADGFQRGKAAKKADLAQIHIELKKGDQRTALLYALGANAEHGIPLTLDERRDNARALLEDEEWKLWSDREISAHVHLSPNTVGKVRKTVAGADVSARKGKDGVVRKKAAKKPANQTPIGVAMPFHLPPHAEIPGLTCHSETSICSIEKTAEKLQAQHPELAARESLILAAVGYHGELSFDQIALLVGFTPTSTIHSLFTDDLLTDAEGVTDGVRLTYAGSQWLGSACDMPQPAPTAVSSAPTVTTPPTTSPSTLEAKATALGYDLPFVRADAARLRTAKVHAPSDLIALACAALYHYAGTSDRMFLPELGAATGMGEIIRNAVSTYPAAIDGDTVIGFRLTAAADAAIDAVLGEASSSVEPEELTAEAPPTPPTRTVAPLTDRRIRWVQQTLATELEQHQAWRGSEGEWCALALLTGIEILSDTQQWNEELVHEAQDMLHRQLRRSVADCFRRGDTRRLPDWRVIAGFWGLDAESINILSTRAIPE